MIWFYKISSWTNFTIGRWTYISYCLTFEIVLNSHLFCPETECRCSVDICADKPIYLWKSLKQVSKQLRHLAPCEYTLRHHKKVTKFQNKSNSHHCFFSVFSCLTMPSFSSSFRPQSTSRNMQQRRLWRSRKRGQATLHPKAPCLTSQKTRPRTWSCSDRRAPPSRPPPLTPPQRLYLIS